MKLNSHLFKTLFTNFRWVFLFLFLSAIAYERQLEKTAILRRELKTHLNELKSEKQEALKQQLVLKLQIENQTDPKWIERILMKKLGLVPKGKTKIVFNPNANSKKELY